MTEPTQNDTGAPPRVQYKRILLKLSGEVFANKEKGLSLDSDILASLARQIKRVKDLDIEIGIVVGGGNIFRGLSGADHGIGRTTGDHMGMLATVINALALQSALEKVGIDTRVMTAFAVSAVAEPFIRRRALRHLEKGRIVIYGAGTGNPYLTTDTAAALRANETDCNVLLKGTKVDGIYSADPMVDKNAVRYPDVTFSFALQNQLRVMDAAAFSLCQDNNIPIIVFNFFKEDEIIRVLEGHDVGTLVHN